MTLVFDKGTTVLAALKRLAVEMARPGNHLTTAGIEAEIHRWLAAPFLSESVHYQVLDEPGGRRLVFQVDHAAVQELVTHHLGARCSSPTTSIGRPSMRWPPMPGSSRLKEFFGASRKVTG